MPTEGRALIGFMSEERAIRYLQESCIPANNDPLALSAEWHEAKGKIGPSQGNPGVPEYRDIPAEFSPYIENLTGGIWRPWFEANSPEICLVEIAPLLAYQFHVDVERSMHHCGGFSSPPTMEELLARCLPLEPSTEAISIAQNPQSIIVKSKSLNLSAQAGGMIGPNVLGLQFGVSLPFAHVVRFNGRSFLHNGYHRLYGAFRAGATHAPCVVRDVNDFAEVGIRSDGNTFDADLLMSTNPPTLLHFHDGVAHNVSMRSMTRILHVSWAEYAIPDE